MIIQQLLFALLSVLVMLVAAIDRPSSAACPPGFLIVEGVRRDGDFVCELAPPPNCGEPTGPFEGVACPDRPRYRAKIYCTGGAEPIIDDDGLTVGCQRVHR